MKYYVQLNLDLASLHYGAVSDAMVAVLNAVLTFDTIPLHETRHFSIQCQEGYFICQATAWNGDWIGGIASPGTDNTKDTYSFIRLVSGGADAVLKKLGSAEVRRASGNGLIIDTGNPNGNIGGVTSLHYKGNYYCGNNNWIDMEYTISISCENGVVKVIGAPQGQGTFTVSAFSMEGN